MELMFCVVQNSLTNGSSVDKICTGSFSNGRSRFRPFDIWPLFAGSEPRSNPSIQRGVNAVYQVNTCNSIFDVIKLSYNSTRQLLPAPLYVSTVYADSVVIGFIRLA